MMFPAKLRVVTKSGIQFFSTAEETWQWIDMQTQEEGAHRSEISHPEQKRKNRYSKTGRMGSPSPVEMLKERQKVMEAAASLNDSDHGSYRQTQEELEQSESEQESELSHSSDRIGPDVTPGTSDCIIYRPPSQGKNRAQEWGTAATTVIIAICTKSAT
ncbi:hypothetical protein NDU88_003245 [Pleurodeles waltl]|uniref:Uncharacterized protein n=1 Tax=Pleurodeles waltl TaxID=8319 RepID=A0AAV7NG27_PLEWA|nr:hypothetical protein NDU88_003245 [Pleurodeles waltl]